MALIPPDSTGMPVHEPVHGRANTTANSATDRDRDGQRIARLPAPSWPSPGLSFPRPEVLRDIPCYLQRRSRRPDRPHCADAVPRPAGEPPYLAELTERASAQSSRCSPSREQGRADDQRPYRRHSRAVPVTGASIISSCDDRRPDMANSEPCRVRILIR